MKKLYQIAALVICLITLLGNSSVFAASYQTYTYSIRGNQLASPDAYSPERIVDSAYMGLETEISDPRDLFVDADNNVYIVDAKNNRVVILDEFYKFKAQLKSFTNDQGVIDSLTSPSGVFVTEKSIYVADTENNRIVIFDRDGKFSRILEKPTSNIFEDTAIYKPVALAVDSSERIYVVSSSTYEGIITLSGEGEFQGYIGAQKVTYNVIDIIWRMFQNQEQRDQQMKNVSSEFNNITIDQRGFIYVTTSSINAATQQRAINAKSKKGDYAPVKQLNSAGDDILKRNGFYPPSGEVNVVSISYQGGVTGASRIIDVAVGPEGTWSIIDEKRSRIFTYDSDGKLLFAFGDTGKQLGNIQSIEAIAYQGDRMLVLDKTNKSFTVYNRTEYGDIIITALMHNNNRQYDLSVSDWKLLLQRNSNFDAAYVGIGKALYRDGNWVEAMEYYKFAYDTVNYSDAFKMYRKDWVANFIILIPIIIVAVCLLVGWFFKFAAKVNKRVSVSTAKRTFGQELLYAFHLIFHPFDGFWDLKHEKRGSVRAALFYVALAILAFTYQSIGRAYIFNPYGSYLSIFTQIISILVPVLLWVTANWCLTTLFEGEGSYKDIFIATAYALVPLPLLIIPSTILTHIVTNSEKGIINLVVSFAWIWVGLLVFFGMMVTHDYTLGKNVLTTLGTIVGVAFIMFVGILFSSLLAKVISFFSSIITEISYRM